MAVTKAMKSVDDDDSLFNQILKKAVAKATALMMILIVDTRYIHSHQERHMEGTFTSIAEDHESPLAPEHHLAGCSRVLHHPSYCSFSHTVTKWNLKVMKLTYQHVVVIWQYTYSSRSCFSIRTQYLNAKLRLKTTFWPIEWRRPFQSCGLLRTLSSI